MNVIAHLSDVHIDDRRSMDRTRAVMEHLDALPCDLDAVLVTGDIADHALPAEYEAARKLLTSRHPTLICPGNHDERAAFRRHLLGEEPSVAPIDQVLRAGGFVIALCDTSVPGEDYGRMEETTLAWLEDVLAGTSAPVLVGFHHPPVTLGIPYVDGIKQYGEERLAGIAARSPHLVAFLAGHAHTAAATTFAGRPLLVAPGVVSTTRLPWETADENDLVHLDHAPSLAFHVLHDDHRLTTHYRPVTMPGMPATPGPAGR
ncbi:metallophosphoesterase [Actinomadura barringtoniae]|uniref:Metallophosphoesterase n=1 Tax=Actinomadura barringtoniae TaxID=1427535 RepID=A0A939PJ94_9ACTN|nr:metallophosphoesterase [Actinomadura barringtoniae]MBO2451098.1 metallophosphoesterase [Actinomadura barringtoniae]